MNQPGEAEDMRSQPDVERFDPSLGTWQPFAKLPAPWSLGPALPKGNLTICAAELGGELFANGGDGSVYRLASDASAWTPAAKLLFPRMFHQLVATPEGLLALGGVPAKARGARVRHVERVSPQPPPAPVVWTLRAESAAKNRQGSFLLAQQLYVFGGNDSLEQHDFEPPDFVASAHRLDLGSLEWKAVEALPRARQSMQTLVAVALPEARSQFGLVEWDNAAWVFGGLNYDKSRKDDEFQHPTSIVRFDPAQIEAGFTPAGVELRQMRRAFAGALLGERFYLTGGLRDNFEPVTECEVVDLKAKTSQPMACPSQHRLGGELVPLGQALYLVGGSAQNADGQREPTTRLEKYDPATDRWTTLTETLPLDTARARRVVVRRSAAALQRQSSDLNRADRPARSASTGRWTHGCREHRGSEQWRGFRSGDDCRAVTKCRSTPG